MELRSLNGLSLPLTVSRDAGTTIALCLHELITNAIKYGALSQSEGHVALMWAIAGDAPQEFSLTWTEVGGPPVREPTRHGYGTRYVRSALGSLFGTVPDIVFAPMAFAAVCEALGERIRAS